MGVDHELPRVSLMQPSVPLMNIYYITPITRRCHGNILPSTGQENNIAQPKKKKKKKEAKKEEINGLVFHLIFHRF